MLAAQALAQAAAKLKESGVPDPVRDARILLGFAAQVDASRITLMAAETLTSQIEERFTQLIEKRSRRVPVSHLIGKRAFYGREFFVSQDVLDPRPETETLIEAALAVPFSRVLDLGTGSGCVLVTLLAERLNAEGLGVDLSDAACLQASANAHQHSVAGRCEIIRSDWFDKVTGRFDLIVCNPPYLALSEMADVSDELRLYEPRMALTDGADGLGAYRILAAKAQQYLTHDGRFCCEFGAGQGPAVKALFAQRSWNDIRLIQDLDGRDRVLIARP